MIDSLATLLQAMSDSSESWTSLTWPLCYFKSRQDRENIKSANIFLFIFSTSAFYKHNNNQIV